MIQKDKVVGAITNMCSVPTVCQVFERGGFSVQMCSASLAVAGEKECFVASEILRGTHKGNDVVAAVDWVSRRRVLHVDVDEFRGIVAGWLRMVGAPDSALRKIEDALSVEKIGESYFAQDAREYFSISPGD